MKPLFYILVIAFVFSCSKENRNLIDKNQIGLLTNETEFYEVKNIMHEDSVVTETTNDGFVSSVSKKKQKLIVFDTSGQKLMEINPLKTSDSLTLIQDVRIFSENYKTNNGIGIGSSFADLKKNHDINNIQTSLSSIIINLKDIDAMVSFSKEVLPGNVRFDNDAVIKSTMIPDDAEINRFWLYFKAEDSNEKN